MSERGMQVGRYIAGIRNQAKRGYAHDVADALWNGRPLPERPANLGTMAAQAVEMRLRELVTA